MFFGRTRSRDRSRGHGVLLPAPLRASTRPALWLRGDSIVGTDGSSYQTWPARVGSDATQGTSSKRPKYRASGINSLPASEGDGVDDNQQAPLTLGVNTVTIYLVCKQVGAVPASGGIFSLGKPGGTSHDFSDAGLMAFYQTSGSGLILYQGNSFQPVAHPGANTTFLATILCNGTNARVRVAGTTSSTFATTNVLNPTTCILYDRWFSGAAGGQPSNVMIAEVLIYPAAFTLGGADDLLVAGYLRNRNNVT